MTDTGYPPPPIDPSVPSLLDIALMVADFLKRHRKLIYLCLVLGLAFGNVYMAMTKPTYTAGASLILDMRNVQFNNPKPMVTDQSLDSAFVESQVEVMRSRAVELAVIRRFDLTSRPEFVKSTGGLLGDAIEFFARRVGGASPPPDYELTERALRVFDSRLAAKRVGLSFIIEITFRSSDPELAAAIANATLEAYIADAKNAKTEITRRAIDWLQESLDGLRQQAIASDRAVVEFKARNNIVSTDGKLINDQQISEVSSQLVTATGQRAEAKARLEHIDSILNDVSAEDSRVDPAVTDALRSEIITKLRTQYLEIANREAEWEVRYGRDHNATVGLRDQMREIRNSMLAELRRIAETYRSDYQVAEQRESNLRQQLAAAIAGTEGTNNAQVTLRELESAAQTYRTLYDDFLHRHMETLQQVSFPGTEGRILSRASRPLRVSWPRASVVYLLSIVLGLLSGLLLSLAFDARAAFVAARAAAGTDHLAVPAAATGTSGLPVP
ncbi:MAG: GumC family protein [Xanthobacteraceae bacterium]|nr:GumC family protein [Xanthobacteraceae bacterium]